MERLQLVNEEHGPHYRKPQCVRDSGERGSVVMFAASLVILLAITALTVDYGILLVTRAQLSTAVDAGALAGGQELPNQADARTIATQYVRLNVPATLNADPLPTVSFPASNVVRVHMAMTMPSIFARIVGLNSFPVGAAAESTRLDPELVLIIDRSGSMCEDSHPTSGGNCPAIGPWQPFSTILQTAKSFVDQMTGDPTFTLISFSTTATLDRASTNNRAVIKADIDDLKPAGTTDIAASVTKAIDELLLTTSQRPKLIVLLTDGLPNTFNGVYNGANTASEARNALIDTGIRAHNHGIVIFTITYGNDADDALMRQVAESSDGHGYSAPNVAALQAVYTDIAGKVYIRLTRVDRRPKTLGWKRVLSNGTEIAHLHTPEKIG